MRRLGLASPGAEPLRIVDVGTGSGAIAVALAASLRRRGAADAIVMLATDVSADALDLARENAVGHAVADRVTFEPADLLPDRLASFDLVLANLPYVRHDAMAGLPTATTFEPALALDGGVDGLEVIGRLVDLLPAALAADGVGAARDRRRPGRGDRGPRRVTVARLVVPGRARPRRPAEGRLDRSRLKIGDVRAAASLGAASTLGIGRASSTGAHHHVAGADPAHPPRRPRRRRHHRRRRPDDRSRYASRRSRRSRPGVLVCLVTGRMVSSAMRFALELELDTPVVGYQGALIREMPVAGAKRLGRLLVHTPLPAAVAREIVVWTRSPGARPASQLSRAVHRPG